MTQFDPEQDDPLSQTWDVFRDMAFGPDEADTPPAIPACLPAYLGNSSLRFGLAPGGGRPPANSPQKVRMASYSGSVCGSGFLRIIS